MVWFRKMPDAVLRRHRASDGTFLCTDLVRTFRAEGKRWCEYRGLTLLLRDDGSVEGDKDVHEWEAL